MYHIVKKFPHAMPYIVFNVGCFLLTHREECVAQTTIWLVFRPPLVSLQKQMQSTGRT